MQPLARRARPQRVRIVQVRIGTDALRNYLSSPRRSVRRDRGSLLDGREREVRGDEP